MFRLDPHTFIDRETGQKLEEKVYGERALALLYGPLRWLAPLIARLSFLSSFYGWLQRRPRSRKKIAPFVAAYGVDLSECEQREFSSFDDFFVRKIVRPIADADFVAPADGRYWVCPDIGRCDHFYVKDQKLSVSDLFGEELERGALVLARLCPTDCHRFLFPCDCVPSEARLINGPLASVNPVSLKRNLRVLGENKRYVTRLNDEVLMAEIGATNVGSVHQTYSAGDPAQKGMEKGFFSFGGSAIALYFERISLCEDLVNNSAQFFETRCQMGQPLGKNL